MSGPYGRIQSEKVPRESANSPGLWPNPDKRSDMANGTCSVRDCDRPQHCKGLCHPHYDRRRRRGTTSPPTRPSLSEKLLARSRPEGDCLVWVGSRNQYGYGKVLWQGRIIATHRGAYELAHGTIPQGMQVDHTCFNRACLNVDHLRLVTPRQNSENRLGPSAISPTGVRGVSRSGRKCLAVVGYGSGKKHRVGTFDTLEDAEAAVVAARLRLHTHNDVDRAS